MEVWCKRAPKIKELPAIIRLRNPGSRGDQEWRVELIRDNLQRQGFYGVPCFDGRVVGGNATADVLVIWDGVTWEWCRNAPD